MFTDSHLAHIGFDLDRHTLVSAEGFAARRFDAVRSVHSGSVHAPVRTRWLGKMKDAGRAATRTRLTSFPGEDLQ